MSDGKVVGMIHLGATFWAMKNPCDSTNYLELHGSIWVVKQIWLAGMTNQNDLIEMLELLSQNTRLPKGAIENLKSEILNSK